MVGSSNQNGALSNLWAVGTDVLKKQYFTHVNKDFATYKEETLSYSFFQTEESKSMFITVSLII